MFDERMKESRNWRICLSLSFCSVLLTWEIILPVINYKLPKKPALFSESIIEVLWPFELDRVRFPFLLLHRGAVYFLYSFIIKLQNFTCQIEDLVYNMWDWLTDGNWERWRADSLKDKGIKQNPINSNISNSDKKNLNFRKLRHISASSDKNY